MGNLQSVWDIATVSSCGVWCLGWITCLLYGSPILEVMHMPVVSQMGYADEELPYDFLVIFWLDNYWRFLNLLPLKYRVCYKALCTVIPYGPIFGSFYLILINQNCVFSIQWYPVMNRHEHFIVSELYCTLYKDGSGFATDCHRGDWCSLYPSWLL